MPRKKAPPKPTLTPADLRMAREACLLAESRVQEDADCARRLGDKLGVGSKARSEIKALFDGANNKSRRFEALRMKIEEMIGG